MTESKPTIQIFRHGNAIAEMPNNMDDKTK